MTMCKCGCGQPAPIATKTVTARGVIKGQPITFIHGHNAQGAPLKDRFWSRVNKTETCWLWTGATVAGGYGCLRADGRPLRAHRVAYELTVGPIPDGLVLDHLCRTPACVRPDHLEPVTQRENILRGTSPAAQFAAATHCKRGHEFTPENTMRRKGSTRECRTCRKHRRAKRPGIGVPAERTHCPRGHAYDAENTYVSPFNGSRNCRKCGRIRKGSPS
jgi:hypothetical protein